MATGTITSVGLIVLSPTVQIDLLHHTSAIFPLKNPALVSVPLAFLVGIVVSVLAPEASSKEAYASVRARMFLGNLDP
jgi:cation/acetate symporter